MTSQLAAKATILVAILAMVAIRAPHGQRSRGMRTAHHRKGPLETGLLAFAWVGFLVPLVWIATGLLAFADYPLHPAAFALGVIVLAAGLWLLHRSHADLGTQWSITLEVREGHRLITTGVYRRIRHPMYAALFLFSLGQLLALPNWIAGPSYLVPLALLVALRLPREERMMIDEFGDDYRAYAARTKRLIPGLW